MEPVKATKIPTKSRRFWIWLLSLFGIVLLLTIWKDWWLTGEEPNALFYLFVPPISILCGVVCVWGMAKLSKLSLDFLDILAIIVGVNVFMQLGEIILKLIYYLWWEYPGILYMVIVLPLGFLLGVYGLVRWGNVTGWKAAILIVAEIIGELAAAGILSGLLGMTTPGS